MKEALGTAEITHGEVGLRMNQTPGMRFQYFVETPEPSKVQDSKQWGMG